MAFKVTDGIRHEVSDFDSQAPYQARNAMLNRLFRYMAPDGIVTMAAVRRLWDKILFTNGPQNVRNVGFNRTSYILIYLGVSDWVLWLVLFCLEGPFLP